MEEVSTQSPIVEARVLPQPPLPNTTPVPVVIVKKSPWPLILAILCIVALALAGYFYWQITSLKSQLAAQSSPSPSPSITTDPTANWKTYTNTQFSFKYPSELVHCSGYGGASIQLWPVPFACPDAHDDIPEISATPYNEGEYQAYKAPVSSRKIEIDGIEATENIIKYNNEDGPWQSLGGATEILVSTKTGLIQIMLWGEKPEQKTRFNQILSTFKFTDQNANDDTVLISYLKEQYYLQGKQYGKTQDEIQIKIDKIEGSYARGTGSFVSGGGDVWFATKISGQWKIVEQTQEPPRCTILGQYNFPESFSIDCIQ